MLRRLPETRTGSASRHPCCSVYLVQPVVPLLIVFRLHSDDASYQEEHRQQGGQEQHGKHQNIHTYGPFSCLRPPVVGGLDNGNNSANPPLADGINQRGRWDDNPYYSRVPGENHRSALAVDDAFPESLPSPRMTPSP